MRNVVDGEINATFNIPVNKSQQGFLVLFTLRNGHAGNYLTPHS
jgi:hypothetical protein